MREFITLNQIDTKTQIKLNIDDVISFHEFEKNNKKLTAIYIREPERSINIFFAEETYETVKKSIEKLTNRFIELTPYDTKINLSAYNVNNFSSLERSRRRGELVTVICLKNIDNLINFMLVREPCDVIKKLIQSTDDIKQMGASNE